MKLRYFFIYFCIVLLKGERLDALSAYSSHHYDENGCLTQQTIYGNLSGECSVPLLFDERGHPIENEIERYSISYHYSTDDPPRLLRISEDNGKTLLFLYEGTQDRPSAQFVLQKDEILSRSFFEYDEEGRLTKTIVDDGRSFDAEDLSVITERHITNFTPLEDQNTLSITRSYYDPIAQKERIIDTALLNYSEAGHLLQQAFLDSNGAYSYGSHVCYNDNPGGREVSYQDTLGNSCNYQFDERGHLLCSDDSSSHPVQAQIPVSYDYDDKGKKISQVDRYGNKTFFHYDESGRLTRIVYPAVLDHDDNTYQPAVEYNYDNEGRITSRKDANGYTTNYAYNARGKPTTIHYPDGSVEQFRYYLDGLLRSKKDRNGLTIEYQYDPSGRLLEKRALNKESILLWNIRNEYNTFHLLSQKDPSGHITYYRYSAAGKPIGKITLTREGNRQQAFHYDSRSLLHAVQEWYGEGTLDYSLSFIERDGAGKEIAVRHESPTGEILQRQKVPPQELASCVEEEITNKLGQRVLKTHHIDEAGVMTNTGYDALGRVEWINHTDEKGNLLSRKELRYDGVGNKVKETITHIDREGHSTAISCSWEYGPMNRIERMKEAHGTPLETVTHYHYYAEGPLKQVVKPNGTTISYEYDDACRISHLYASDGSIDYRISYDSLGNITHVADSSHSHPTTRRYLDNTQVTEEQLGNGLTLYNTFDLKGRRSHLQLPDGSSVEYRYDGCYLREVSRFSFSFNHPYTHRYLLYDKEGHPLKMQLVGQAGDLKMQWDARGRPKFVSSAYWIASTPEEGYDAEGHLTHLLVSDAMGSQDSHYDYDEQGRLVSEVSQKEHRYVYDVMNNRIEVNGVECTYNLLNQLCRQGNILYDYDKNGNLIKKCEDDRSTYYAYDAFDRLICITQPHHYTLEYTYDLFHRRLTEKRYHWESGAWTLKNDIRFLYDGDNEIGTVGADGLTRQLRVLGIGQGAELGATVAVELDGQLLAPLHNWQGSITALVDANTGQLREGYRYNAFGEEQIYSADRKWQSKSLLNNPWRYSSKRVDEDSGLIYFGRRFYDPKTGRWITKDPLGNADGPNSYAYVHNDPINYRDLRGLLTVPNLWESASFTTEGLRKLLAGRSFNIAETFFNTCKQLGFDSSKLERLAESLLGYRNFFMAGYSSCKLVTGSCGKGEVSDKVRITYINGIMTSLEDIITQASYISSSHGNNNVHYIYSPSYGWTWDLTQGAFVKILHYITPQAYALAAKWKALIQEMGGIDSGGVIIHYAHSVGGSDSVCAKQLLSPEERSMIHLYTFGSATLVDSNEEEFATNYVSYRDGVPYLDPFAYIDALWNQHPHVIFLGSPLDGFPIVDHLFTSETYRQIWEGLGKEFISTFGHLE